MDPKIEEMAKDNDYVANFDPKVYLETYYCKIEGHMFVPTTLKSQHKIYSTGTVKGKRLLDMGCGPTIHNVMPAAKWFDEIILSDYTPANLEAQKKWLNKDKDAADWTQFFKYFSKLDGNEDDWLKLETELRNKIKQVVPCDVHLANPLHPLKIDMVDAICTSLCLVPACPDVPSYAKALKNVVSLLKPGGMLVLLEIFDSPIYTVGHKVFKCLGLQKQDALNAIETAGLTVLEVYDYDIVAVDPLAPSSGIAVFHAQKNA